MPNNLIKQAFSAIKQDILQLGNQISILSQELQQLQAQNALIDSFTQDTKALLDSFQNQQKILQSKQISIQETDKLIQNNLETIKIQQKLIQNELKISQNQLKIAENALKEHISAHKPKTSTLRHITSTPSTDNLPSQALKQPNLPISTGNEGVPTDRQTNQQTDKYPLFSYGKSSKNAKNAYFEQKYDETPENLLKIASGVYSQPRQTQPILQETNQLDKASEFLENLDSLKKEIRRKFKSLTPQEFKVFTAIYQLENMQLTVDYALLSKKLKLSQSSIRDYISRIISKKIPIIKEKINNKQVIVRISADLKKIASLAAILQLREL